jgi:RNA polymerase sigma factor (sigma-70 family)
LKISIPEEQIIAAMRQPESAALALQWLMDAYQDPLYWHIRHIVLYHEDASDVLQDTFLKVFRSMSSFEARSGLYTWLYRIAQNAALDFLRKKQQQPVNLTAGAHESINQQLRADSWFDGDEAEIQLLQAIEQLPVRQKEVFQLRYFDEMPYSAMAELLGTSEGSLKASYHHAVKKIEQQLVETNQQTQ